MHSALSICDLLSSRIIKESSSLNFQRVNSNKNLDSSTSIEPSMDAPKKLGPSGYGGIQGTAKDINSNSVPKNLKSVSIWSKGGNTGRINAISFTYYDKDNIEVNEGPWGTTDGTPNISIGHDEYLTKLCVTTANNCVTSLTFNTSKPAVHGPMGKEPTTGDKAFTIDVDPDSIVAFFGRADHYLRAIGAYSAPQA
ncbi:hypothetical protein QYE76_036975 [Lolium multiflorum]|uniref:Jacalin-type lectin domain-containing protein n=1 Tax=Lolium multiflorum TaxID=4521 RepID=A0AAD8R3W2_LOLMU|nr:hypothetical protein QYE76_036975 [Lolium multiflorum]